MISYIDSTKSNYIMNIISYISSITSNYSVTIIELLDLKLSENSENIKNFYENIKTTLSENSENITIFYENIKTTLSETSENIKTTLSENSMLYYTNFGCSIKFDFKDQLFHFLTTKYVEILFIIIILSFFNLFFSINRKLKKIDKDNSNFEFILTNVSNGNLKIIKTVDNLQINMDKNEKTKLRKIKDILDTEKRTPVKIKYISKILETERSNGKRKRESSSV